MQCLPGSSLGEIAVLWASNSTVLGYKKKLMAACIFTVRLILQVVNMRKMLWNFWLPLTASTLRTCPNAARNETLWGYSYFQLLILTAQRESSELISSFITFQIRTECQVWICFDPKSEIRIRNFLWFRSQHSKCWTYKKKISSNVFVFRAKFESRTELRRYGLLQDPIGNQKSYIPFDSLSNFQNANRISIMILSQNVKFENRHRTSSTGFAGVMPNQNQTSE